MKRKNFIRSLMIGAISTPVIIEACKKNSIIDGSDTSGTNGTCTLAPTETEGPFPTKVPTSYVRSDITDGRSGYKMTAKITVGNVNNSCEALAGAIVDIWHCDAEGKYSEYGGNGIQSTNYQSVHFLRGRQTTDANGLVTFTTIFPGWYNGRATHIHVHVYNAAGTSLNVTQIAFPEGAGTSLTLVNGYSKGLSGYTYNNADNVFSDDKTGVEIATVTGTLTAGFELTFKVNVKA